MKTHIYKSKKIKSPRSSNSRIYSSKQVISFSYKNVFRDKKLFRNLKQSKMSFKKNKKWNWLCPKLKKTHIDTKLCAVSPAAVRIPGSGWWAQMLFFCFWTYWHPSCDEKTLLCIACLELRHYHAKLDISLIKQIELTKWISFNLLTVWTVRKVKGF